MKGQFEKKTESWLLIFISLSRRRESPSLANPITVTPFFSSFFLIKFYLFKIVSCVNLLFVANTVKQNVENCCVDKRCHNRITTSSSNSIDAISRVCKYPGNDKSRDLNISSPGIRDIPKIFLNFYKMYLENFSI